MGRSATRNAGGKDGTTSRRQAAPRPKREDNDEGPATVRNILPWRNMEKELAKRLAEKAAKGEISTEMLKDPLDAPSWRGAGAVGSAGSGDRDIEPAPDSGVRHSSADGVDAISSHPQAPDDPHRPLTYSVYTASEIEAVRQQRMSMVAIQVEPQPSSWVDVRKSLAVLVRAFYTGYLKAKPRPRLRDVCQVPAIAFLADLRAAGRQLPWKKIGWIATVAGGAIALLLFTVITVAELTDDLKPTRPEASAVAAKAPPPPPVATGEAAPATSNEAPIELDDDSANAPAAPAPTPAAAPPKPKPKASAAATAAATKPKPKASAGSPQKPSGPQFNP